MAKYVREIINPEMFFLGPYASLSVARGCILYLGITACPILDEDGRPVGVVSLRDIARAESGKVGDVMSSPVKTVSASATIEEGARQLAEANVHRLVAIDEDGRAIGMASSLDLIRGLLSMPLRFPEQFHHLDTATGLEWRGDYDLREEDVAGAPDAPGLIVIKYGVHGVPEVPIWVGLTDDIRGTLQMILREPKEIDPLLANWTEEVRERFRYRTAVVEDAGQRLEALDTVRANSRIRAWAREISATS